LFAQYQGSLLQDDEMHMIMQLPEIILFDIFLHPWQDAVQFSGMDIISAFNCGLFLWKM